MNYAAEKMAETFSKKSSYPETNLGESDNVQPQLNRIGECLEKERFRLNAVTEQIFKSASNIAMFDPQPSETKDGSLSKPVGCFTSAMWKEIDGIRETISTLERIAKHLHVTAG